MSVIIRLQNLPWSANALDIRQFFSGLSIPEGGVHIVGGEQGDAFIAFSTDEDARQAFNLNGGKIKEVQIKLMLSSRTEMQKVIEAARNPLAAFMQRTPAPQPLPAIIPAAIPAAIPELKKEDSKDKEKRDRRRSRSRSRDRKDRSRDRDRRDRRRRDRSRSRSRDRRDRRRRERSHSRERRSKDRDRRSKDRRHSEDKTGSSSNSSAGNTQKDPKMGIWENPVRVEPSADIQDPQVFIDTFMPNVLEEARRNLNALNARSAILLGNKNGFQSQNEGFAGNNQGRDSWNGGPGRPDQGGRHNFGTRLDRNLQGGNTEHKFSQMNPRTQLNNRSFGDNPRGGFSRPASTRADGRNSRFEPPSERPGLLERPALLEHPGLLERPSSEHLKNCCVQLRPFYGGYGEIRRFFQGIFIHNTGIKFINDENGKRTGIVYVRFATPDGKEKSLQRSGAHLKHQPVEVTHLDDSIFDKTVDRYHPDYMKDHSERSEPPFKTKNPHVYNKAPTHFSCLAVEDLPLFTKEQDMLKIFSDFSMLSILLVNRQRHITAYIKFTNSEDAKKAMAEKNKHVFDGKTLNIRPCPDEEYALISHEDGDLDDDDEDEDDEVDDDKPFVTSECVSLSGLPLKTTDRDISDFFSDVAIVPKKIHLISSNLGFTGQAFCEFSSARDAEVALSKNGLPLGSGTISVKSVSKSEMEGTLGIVSRNTNINPNPNPMRPFFPRGFGHIHGPRGMGLMGHRPPMRRFLPPQVNPTDMASPGCTVLMENVPYKAGLDEILDFFEGFDVAPDNVLRRYNENGTPSGEAKVIFNSAEDAFQALQDRHMSKIRDRTVYLSQC